MSDISDYSSVSGALVEQLYLEADAMLRYALTSGFQVPARIITVLESAAIAHESGDLNEFAEPLNYAHGTLTELVAPALPGTLYLIRKEAEKMPFFRFLGTLPVTRKMVIMCIASLIAVIALALSSDVNSDVLSKGVLDESGGQLLVNLLFLCAAASLGAGFSILFKLRKEVRNATYRPIFEGHYWTSWVMGMVAGFILAEVLSGDELKDLLGGTMEQSKLVLALAGGFSSSLVYGVLNKVVEALGSLIKGDTDQEVQVKVESVKVSEKEKSMKRDLELAMGLNRISHSITDGADANLVKEEIDQLLNTLLPHSNSDWIPANGGKATLIEHSSTVVSEPESSEFHNDANEVSVKEEILVNSEEAQEEASAKVETPAKGDSPAREEAK